MKRIKINIIELEKLYKTPCKEWLERFENGKIDAHEAFKKYGEQYEWLYLNSPYDIIGWQIEHDCFDWKNYSRYVAQYCPEYIDPDKYNWEEYSVEIAKYCPEHLDKERYNWDWHSWAVAQYCPEKIDPDKYNWELHSWAVIQYCPEYLELSPKNVLRKK